MATNSITRRGFSKSFLAAGAWAMSSPVLKGNAPPSEKIRVAFIGMRNRGWQNALAFHHFGPFEVATICDCDSAMFDEAMKHLSPVLGYKPKMETDFRKVLDDPTIDVIANSTPDHWHALITVMALQAGKHVYHEKPASYNLDDGKAMVAAQKKHANLVVAMGTQQRSGQHFIDAKRFIDDDGLGKIGFARAWMLGPRPFLPIVPDTAPPATMNYDLWCGPAPVQPYNEYKVHYNWHFQKAYGTGDTGNWGGHWLDIVRWYADLDLPTSCQGYGTNHVVKDAKQTPDTQNFLFEYPNMTVAWEERNYTNYGLHGMSNGAEFVGDKGTMIINRDGWRFHPNEGEVVGHKPTPMGKPHIENFTAAIKGHAKPSADISEGHKTAALVHLGNIAATVGRRIEFDPKTQQIKNDKQAQAMTGRAYRKGYEMPKL